MRAAQLKYSLFNKSTKLTLPWFQPDALLDLIQIDRTDEALMQEHAATLMRAGTISVPTDTGSPAYNERKAEIQRGMLGELAIEYLLLQRNLVFKYNVPVSSESDLEIDWDFLPDFQLKAKAGPDITLEAKTCPESLTNRGSPYKLVLIKDGKMDADYCIPVKIFERISPGSRVWVAGFKTRAEIDRLELLEKGYGPCTKHACKPVDLEQPMSPIAELLDKLDRECLHWDISAPS
jgi:hypothetical protein